MMMKKVTIALALAAALTVGLITAAFAQTATPNQWQPRWACPMWGSWGPGSYDPSKSPTLQRLADKLGIGASDLVSQLQAGKSVADVAKEKNVDIQSLVNVLLQPQLDMLQLRVKYGYITQEQADALRKTMEENAKNRLEQKGFFGGFGLGRGMMGSGFGSGYGMMGRGFMGGPGGRW